MYYTIDEETARRAKEMNSFSDYVPGSATEEYRRMVDKAAALAEKCKAGRSEREQDKIDYLLSSYARRLADNINAQNRNRASCPSVLIAGPANFPVKKKQRQNAREDTLMHEYQEIASILDRIRSVGRGGIRSDDPEAAEKLAEKLEKQEAMQARMKAANAFYRKHKTLDDCPDLTPEQIETLKASMARDWRPDPKPFESYQLSANNAKIRALRERLEALQSAKAAPAEDEQHDGYTYREDTEIMRVQFIFDGKPGTETRDLLKANGFRWAPSQGAWQRQLTPAGKAAAKSVQALLK